MRWIKFSNGFVYQVDEQNYIKGVVALDVDLEDGLEGYLDALSQAATGSIVGIEDISYSQIGGWCFFGASVSSIALDEDEVAEFDPSDRTDLISCLTNQYALDSGTVLHAVDSLGVAYGEERVTRLTNGRELRTPVEGELSYVRITLPGVTPIELAYWNLDEWVEQPTEVITAITNWIA